MGSPGDSRLLLLDSVLVSHPLEDHKEEKHDEFGYESDLVGQRKAEVGVPFTIGVLRVITMTEVEVLFGEITVLFLMVFFNAPSRPFKLRVHHVPKERQVTHRLEHRVPELEHQRATCHHFILPVSDTIVDLV